MSSLFFSAATRDSSRASSIQCSATFSYALLMDGSVACAARCLASSAFRRQASLSDDIRGDSSDAPNREEKPRRSGAKGICGRRVFGLPQRDNSERGGWFQKEKPRRATGLKKGGGPDMQQAPPLHVRGPTRPNWGGGTKNVALSRLPHTTKEQLDLEFRHHRSRA